MWWKPRVCANTPLAETAAAGCRSWTISGGVVQACRHTWAQALSATSWSAKSTRKIIITMGQKGLRSCHEAHCYYYCDYYWGWGRETRTCTCAHMAYHWGGTCNLLLWRSIVAALDVRQWLVRAETPHGWYVQRRHMYPSMISLHNTTHVNMTTPCHLRSVLKAYAHGVVKV